MRHEHHPDPDKARRYFEAKMAFTTGPGELDEMRRSRDDIAIVDVRRADDYEQGHVPGALSLPEEEWLSPAELDAHKLIIVYCYSQACHLAAKAAVQLTNLGFSVMEMEGGFEAWRKHELPIEHGRPQAGRASGRAGGRSGLDAAQASFAPTY